MDGLGEECDGECWVLKPCRVKESVIWALIWFRTGFTDFSGVGEMGNRFI